MLAQGTRRKYTTWENLSDGYFDVGMIGAVAIAPSDHNMDPRVTASNADIATWESAITQLKHKTYEDEGASWETMLAGQLRYLLNVIDNTGPPVTDGAMIRLQALKSEWATRQAELDSIASEHIAPINAWVKAHQVDHVR